MKKIKSVTLAKYYNDGHDIIEPGTQLIKEINELNRTYYIFFNDKGDCVAFSEIQVRENKTGLFQIEYEEDIINSLENTEANNG